MKYHACVNRRVTSIASTRHTQSSHSFHDHPCLRWNDARMRKPGRSLGAALVFVLILLIRTYQAYVRPFLFGGCKFHPTCSEFAIEALQNHGAARGSILAAGRLVRCHPFGPGGLDPVPPVQPRAPGARKSHHSTLNTSPPNQASAANPR